VRIELASGERPHDGYLHCDERVLPATELVCRVERLPFAEGSVESMLASHIIEHFSYLTVHEVLAEWHRALQPGGNVLIITPNFGYVAHGYADGWMDHEEARNRTFGGQDYEGNYHYNMFDSGSLRRALENTGFRNVKDVTSNYENRKIPMSIYFNAEK
jgi:ubiquinone/menaquinone biosynthesis C-methylase UbiE